MFCLISIDLTLNKIITIRLTKKSKIKKKQKRRIKKHEKLIVFISAMLLIASSLMAEANLGFGGGVDFKINLTESQQSKGGVSKIFEGDDQDAYNIKLSYAGMFNDNKTFFLMALDTDGEDWRGDALNNDDAFFLLINHKPNDFVEIQVTGGFRFSEGTGMDAYNDNDNGGILDEWANADGVYLKLKPNSMFNITFFPMNASTTIGSEFTSTSSQGGRWDQTADGTESMKANAGTSNELGNSNVAGIGLDFFPMEGLSINAVINSKRLNGNKDTTVANTVDQYNAIGYRASVKYVNNDMMNLNAAVEINGNTQKSSDTLLAINANKGLNSYAATQMAINIRASLVPVENLTLSTEFAMTTLNGAALQSILPSSATTYAERDTTAAANKILTENNKTYAKQYDGETGIAFMFKAAYDFSSLIPMENQKSDFYAKFRMYGDNFVWDDGNGTDNFSFVAKNGAFNRIDAGLNFNWNGVNVNPEFTLRTADKKIFKNSDGRADDTRTTATINIGYKF